LLLRPVFHLAQVSKVLTEAFGDIHVAEIIDLSTIGLQTISDIVLD